MSLDPHRGYDLIGDIHGCAQTLERLLERLGYSRQGGVWCHPTRMVIFLGDLVDRGPGIREGNHESMPWVGARRRRRVVAVSTCANTARATSV